MILVFLLGFDLFISLHHLARILLSFPSGANIKESRRAQAGRLEKFDLYDAAAALWANGMDYKA